MSADFSIRQEIIRKSIHLGSFFLGWALLMFGRQALLPVVLLLGIGLPLLDIARRSVPPFTMIYTFLFSGVTRPSEQTSMTGAALMFVGIMIAVLLFRPEPAAAGIFFICFGDTGAALVGRRLGRTYIGNKTLEGTLTFILISVIIASVLPGISVSAGILAAVVSGLIELLVQEGRYDNLIIPPVTAFIIQFAGGAV